MKKLTALLGIGALAFAGACSEQGNVVAPDDAAFSKTTSTATVYFTGNGFNFDGTTYNLNDERCGLTGQNDANDGGTGQFADWNGPGEPYETGQGYLVWVLTANGATSAMLHLPDTTVAMIKVGGTFKYASQYYSYSDLIGPPAVSAVYAGTVRGNVNLVVSHGCQPFTANGAWCSPGYWKNAQSAAWTLTGYAKTDLFNDEVYDYWYGATFAANPTLFTVLDNPSTYSGSPLAGTSGYALNAFNATGAMLTDAIPGYSFDFSLIGSEEACPIDNHGNWKDPQ
jgi:hypothetical protein